MVEQSDAGGHVFISYVRENKAAVDLMQRAFEAAGIRVWRDTADLWPGEDWRQKIRTAIVNDALVFIACFSSESNARSVTYQNEELTLGIEQLRLRRPDKPWLIPVRFDDCEIPDLPIGGGRTLGWLQHTNLYGPSLRENTDRLVEMVLRILGGPLREPVTIPGPPVIKELMSRNDSIITFYSYKGGTGRTLALANVAWILAANGRRVLVADWDLESPGLHKFFQPFIDGAISDRPGILDLIRRYEWVVGDLSGGSNMFTTTGRNSRNSEQQTISEIIDAHIRYIGEYSTPVNWQFPGQGCLDFLSPGKSDRDYVATLSALDWDNFYNNLYGAEFFEALRLHFKQEWDYVLVDSRTGLSDVADICTLHLPDVLLDCFTLSAQSIDGAAMIAESVGERTHRDIRVLPVPMRIDDRQKERSNAGLAEAIRRFPELPTGMSEEQRRIYWSTIGVPYRGSYTYGETLAVFDQSSGESLLSSFERITGYITNGAVTSLPSAG